MTTFFLDLWQDLRAKRLWPIAVGLLVATVAVPALLFKPASSATQSAGTGQAANGNKLPTVALDASSVDSSHLDVFKQKNPFSASSDTVADPNAVAAAAGASSVGNSVGSAVSSAGSSASSSSGSGGGSTGGPAPTGPDGNPVTPGIHYFTYTADVRFGPRSDIKTYKGMRELDLLPDATNPVVSFMGVRDGKTAMFFIADPAFRADGEGRCAPTPDNCMFVYLTKDESHNEETLSAQNGQVEYVLELTGLHTKSLSEDQAVGDTTPDKSAKKTVAKQSKKVRATLLSMPAVRLTKR